MTVQKYIQLNTSMKQKALIWELTERGFGSEVTIMLLGMLHCLENKTEFKLSSKYANLAFQNGWTDYFFPFCDECNYFLLKKSFRSISLNYYQPDKFGRKIKAYLNFSNYILSLFYMKRVYRLYDVWNAVWNKDFENKTFYIPELNIDGDCHHACQILLENIWRIKPEVQQFIDQQIAALGLGDRPYASLFIRRGDKLIEADYVDAREYVHRIRKFNPDIATVFIGTDDYRCVEELRQTCPTWDIFTLCDPQKRGHYQAEFNRQSPIEKRNEMIRLLTIITILTDSQFFVSTFSSNFARLIGLLKGIETCESVDINKNTLVY